MVTSFWLPYQIPAESIASSCEFTGFVFELLKTQVEGYRVLGVDSLQLKFKT